MTYMMGPGLTAELEYRRETLERIGRGAVPGASRGTRRAERRERAARACAPCGPATARTRAA
jgi:hypothetical protein